MSIAIKILVLAIGFALLCALAVCTLVPNRRRVRTPAEYAAEVSYRLSSMRVRQLHMRCDQSRDLQQVNKASREVRSTTARLQAATVRLERCLEGLHS